MKNLKQMKVIKKLCAKRGVTLIETLAAVAVLSLLSMILGTGLLMAQKSYTKITEKSETQLLLSTATNVLANELRYAKDVETDGNLVKTYTSITYGQGTAILLKEGMLFANEKSMLSTGAYGNGRYEISQLEITYDDTEGIFHVFMEVGGNLEESTQTVFDIGCLHWSENEGGSNT